MDVMIELRGCQLKLMDWICINVMAWNLYKYLIESRYKKKFLFQSDGKLIFIVYL